MYKKILLLCLFSISTLNYSQTLSSDISLLDSKTLVDFPNIKIDNFDLNYQNNVGTLNYNKFIFSYNSFKLNIDSSKLSIINNPETFEVNQEPFNFTFQKSSAGNSNSSESSISLELNNANINLDNTSKKININFESGIVNNKHIKNLNFTCSNIVVSKLSEIFRSSCLKKMQGKIALMDLRDSSKTSKLPKYLKHINISVLNNNFKITAIPTNSNRRMTLRFNGSIYVYKEKSLIVFNLTKATYGFFSIKKTIYKKILKSFPKAVKKNDSIYFKF